RRNQIVTVENVAKDSREPPIDFFFAHSIAFFVHIESAPFRSTRGAIGSNLIVVPQSHPLSRSTNCNPAGRGKAQKRRRSATPFPVGTRVRQHRSISSLFHCGDADRS